MQSKEKRLKYCNKVNVFCYTSTKLTLVFNLLCAVVCHCVGTVSIWQTDYFLPWYPHPSYNPEQFKVKAENKQVSKRTP